jgi:hypothetical protein
MFDFSDPTHQPFDELIDALESLATAQGALVRDTSELVELRKQFTALTGLPAPTGGTTQMNYEQRLLMKMMKAQGWKRHTDCVAGGWKVYYEREELKGEVTHIPFCSRLAHTFDETEPTTAEYRAVISALAD